LIRTDGNALRLRLRRAQLANRVRGQRTLIAERPATNQPAVDGMLRRGRDERQNDDQQGESHMDLLGA
jgi:hypothetical protein